jgi:hypothetical protein
MLTLQVPLARAMSRIEFHGQHPVSGTSEGGRGASAHERVLGVLFRWIGLSYTVGDRAQNPPREFGSNRIFRFGRGTHERSAESLLVGKAP